MLRKAHLIRIATMATGLLLSGQVFAENHTISCQLYNASDISDETTTKVDLEKSGQTLSSSRTSSFCVLDDGRVAEKHFVVNQRITDGGATGFVQGISVYTLPNGDSVTATFTGDWGSGGLVGKYEIIDGTGTYDEAKGDGTFTGAQSPWATTSMFDVVLNITTQ